MVRRRMVRNHEYIMSTLSRLTKKRLWTAVAHVKPNPGNDMLHGAPGAFVPVIVLAANARNVLNMVKNKLDTCEFKLERIEDIGQLSSRSLNTVAPELLSLADGLTPQDPVAFGSFHSYEQ